MGSSELLKPAMPEASQLDDFFTQMSQSIPDFAEDSYTGVFSLLKQKRDITGTSLAVQWLGLRASTAGVMGSTSGRGSKITHAMRRRPKKKQGQNQWSGS